MRKFLTVIISVFCVSQALLAQTSYHESPSISSISSTQATNGASYYYPPGYFGLLNNQLTSTRSQGMGFTTLTQGGIENSFYNPAAIAASEAPIQAYVNFANGHSYRPKSKYYFVGVAGKINDKLSVGISYFTYVDNDPVWTTIIGGTVFDTDKFTQSNIALVAAYQLTDEIQLGLSGNFFKENAINGEKTNSDFIPTLGLNYSKSLDIFKSEKIEKQRIIGSLSLFNFLFDNTTEQEYDGIISNEYLPIILAIGAGYEFSLPFKSGWASDKKYFANTDQALDFSFRLQYQDYLAGKDPINLDHESNSSFGVGAEAWFWERLSLRIGYYTQKGPSGQTHDGDTWVTGNRSGFTWGYGTLIPTNDLTGNKLPFNVEVNLVTSTVMSTINEKVYTPPAVFTENKFQFCLGVNLLWVGME